MNKRILLIDGDIIAYLCAAAAEERSILVTHRPTGITKSFKTRTAFKKVMKEKNKEIEYEKNDESKEKNKNEEIEEIEKIIGPIKVHTKDNSAPSAPGMFTKHYAPKTKSFLVEDIEKELKQKGLYQDGLHSTNTAEPKDTKPRK